MPKPEKLNTPEDNPEETPEQKKMSEELKKIADLGDKKEPSQENVETQQEGFNRTEWLDVKIPEIEQLKGGESVEFLIPPDIDYRFFIAELGKPARTYEFGGVYNPKTRSIKIVRGYADGERGGLSRAQVGFTRPRLNPDNHTTDDIFFHTHPWQEKNTVREFNIPETACKPSEEDTDNIMAVRKIEEEDNFERTVVSIIGSRGHISVTEAGGINFDEDELKSTGISEDQLQKVKDILVVGPPIWVKNYANNAESEKLLVKTVEDFYLRKNKIDKTLSFEELKKEITPYTRKEDLDKLIEKLSSKLPTYPRSVFLGNIGLTEQQIKLVHKMTGVKISTYLVEEGMGLKPKE